MVHIPCCGLLALNSLERRRLLKCLLFLPYYFVTVTKIQIFAWHMIKWGEMSRDQHGKPAKKTSKPPLAVFLMLWFRKFWLLHIVCTSSIIWLTTACSSSPRAVWESDATPKYFYNTSDDPPEGRGFASKWERNRKRGMKKLCYLHNDYSFPYVASF